MTKRDGTYQNSKIGLPQGADRLDIDSDGLFDFFGEATVTGAILKKLLYTNNQKTIILSSTGVLSTINLSPGVKFLEMSSGASNTSAWLPSCNEGDEITVIMLYWSIESLCSVFISLSGCSLAGITFSDLSSVSLHTSDASAGWIKFKCFTDDEWSIVERSGAHLIVEQSIS